MRGPKHINIINGQPVVTTGQQLYTSCCNCGLVHLFKFARSGKEFVLVAYRDDFLTKLNRPRRRNSRASA